MEKDNKTDSASNTNKTNKKYKDTVFRMIFNNKKEALGLYNNLFDTNYTDESLVNIVTLEDVLFIPRKNDVAFTMNGRFVVLVEHQSTINENMPLRLLGGSKLNIKLWSVLSINQQLSAELEKVVSHIASSMAWIHSSVCFLMSCPQKCITV